MATDRPASTTNQQHHTPHTTHNTTHTTHNTHHTTHNAGYWCYPRRLPSWQDTGVGSNDVDQGWGTVDPTTGFRKFILVVKANMGDDTGYQWVTATFEAYTGYPGYTFANLPY